ncbi:MAG: HlyD family type I secretion periplasmic adaptor subunit [Henriciella sp.]
MAERGQQSSKAFFAFGWAVIGAVIGGLLIWSIAAPFQGAVIANGTITVEGEHQAVQHLEGGIVSEILVREGDQIEQGEALIQLDPSLSNASLSALEISLADLRAREARLIAERDDLPNLTTQSFFPDALSPAQADAISVQIQFFEARKTSRNTQLSILSEKEAQLDQRSVALAAEVSANRAQLVLLDEEITGLQSLLSKGLVPKSRILALQRRQAELVGGINALQADIVRIRVEVGETRLEKIQYMDAFREAVVSELADVQTELSELNEKHIALRRSHDLLTVRAPKSGRILGVQAHTIGGVVPPYEPIMYIVPQDEQLIVSVRISPQDIDKVSIGQAAKLRFTAFNQNTTPEIEGALKQVSADTIIDPVTSLAFYEGRIELPATVDLPVSMTLVPGMPVDAMLQTETRNVLSYLLRPAQDAMSKTFKE